MINKPFDEIDKTTIDALVADKHAEVKTLEYKQELPGGNDSAKKEFLADVSSFANASGGDIVYGITEELDDKGKKTGKPGDIIGITGITGDDAKLWIENIIRDGLDPRLKAQPKIIEGFPNSFIIVLRIPSSLSAPHMVTYGGTSRFYSRNSAGKYQLDVGEIKSAFLASEALPERIKHFREQRLAQIVADETPVLLEAPPRLVIHLVPLTAFRHTTKRADIFFAGEVVIKIVSTTPMTNFRHNFDGYLGYRSLRGSKSEEYLQFYRSGILEYVDCGFVDKETSLISSVAYERSIIEKIGKYLILMKGLEVETPILIIISLLGVKGFSMDVGRRSQFRFPPTLIDRDTLILPDRMVESYGMNASHILKPVFDTIWQACGFERSSNYDDDGNWNPS